MQRTNPCLLYLRKRTRFVAVRGSIDAMAKAAAAERTAATIRLAAYPATNDATPAANEIPTSWAIRLTVLLTPEARPSSSSLTLDSTEAVNGGTNTAKEMPSNAIGTSTPNVSDASLPNAIRI